MRQVATLIIAWSCMTIGGVASPPGALAAPTNPLCESGSYRRAHPLICDTGGGFPGIRGGNGGGDGGGLIGLIGGLLGGLGGLL